MGIYDTYVGIQLKIGDNSLREYELGDSVDIPDSVYVAPDGIIVIIEGKLAAKFDFAISKWGDIITTTDMLTNFTPWL